MLSSCNGSPPLIRSPTIDGLECCAAALAAGKMGFNLPATLIQLNRKIV